jgi:hypothetical protein
MYVVLMTFCLQVGCLYAMQGVNKEPVMISFFRKRIRDKKSSSLWTFIFQFLPYIQNIVLIYMFAIGIANPDRLQNMIYILAFVIYFAYPGIYRSTSIILMLVCGVFIIGQYGVSLMYKIFFTLPHTSYNRIWVERLY